jgi:hypothetical protein
MLSGTANIEALAAGAPMMTTLAAVPLELAQVDVLQVLYEIGSEHRQTLLPPALHPTDPALINWLVYRCENSPWGPLTMTQTRIECRSGLRLRAFLVLAVIDNAAAAAALSANWGFAVRVGEVRLQRHYDAAQAIVTVDRTCVLDLAVSDPTPLDPGDIQYVPSMHLAHTPQGLRLVQIETRYQIARAERATPRGLRFAGDAWGLPDVRPIHPVSASLALSTVTIPRIRFVCRPDVWAFEGTESVA